jgi:translation elongation factor EF-1alpha
MDLCRLCEVNRARRLCSLSAAFSACTLLAQILELLEHTPIFSAGYKCILHIHSVVEECECTEMRYELDPKTKSKKKVRAQLQPVLLPSLRPKQG